MKRVEAFFGYVIALAFVATAIVAAVVVATLFIKGPARQLPPETIAVVSEPQPEQEVAEAPAASEARAGAREPVDDAGIDVAAGERAWGQCRACHAIAPDGRSGIGPNLWGIVGAQVAAIEGFNYSDALRAADGQVWDVALLDAFLTRPAEAIPGNRMTYNGMRDAAARRNLIAWMAQRSDTPQSPEDLGLAAAANIVTTEDTPSETAGVDAFSEEEYEALLEAFRWMNPPARPAAEAVEARARADAITAALATMDYEAARFHPLHYPPESLSASNEECLACHAEILSHRPRAASLAGVPDTASIAWYQTLDTYAGAQESFHHRHMLSDFAQATMNLQCRFCHQGTDPREESPDMIVGRENHTAPEVPEFTLRKVVNPSTTCLMCHGAFPAEEMGLVGSWHEIREDFEWEPGINGCLTCHEDAFRTNRHHVTFLNAGNIEALGRAGSSDSCYGCHGGRAWYMIPYPYARNPWPGMDDEVPDWAIGRPTASDPDYAFTPVNPAD